MRAHLDPPCRSWQTLEGYYNGYEHGTVIRGSAIGRETAVPGPLPRQAAATRHDSFERGRLLLHKMTLANRPAAATLVSAQRHPCARKQPTRAAHPSHTPTQWPGPANKRLRPARRDLAFTYEGRRDCPRFPLAGIQSFYVACAPHTLSLAVILGFPDTARSQCAL